MQTQLSQCTYFEELWFELSETFHEGLKGSLINSTLIDHSKKFIGL